MLGRVKSKVSQALSKSGRHVGMSEVKRVRSKVGMREVKDESGSLEVWLPCWDV